MDLVHSEFKTLGCIKGEYSEPYQQLRTSNQKNIRPHIQATSHTGDLTYRRPHIQATSHTYDPTYIRPHIQATSHTGDLTYIRPHIHTIELMQSVVTFEQY